MCIGALEGFVVVVFAEHMKQAREYKSLPVAHDIHPVISEHNEHPISTKENDERR
jgi:hypothetical protein